MTDHNYPEKLHITHFIGDDDIGIVFQVGAMDSVMGLPKAVTQKLIKEAL